MSRQRTMAPRVTPSSAILIWRSSASLRRSTKSDGDATRNASIGTRLWPPASGLASPSWDASSPTASLIVAGQAYSKGGNFISRHASFEPQEWLLFQAFSNTAARGRSTCRGCRRCRLALRRVIVALVRIGQHLPQLYPVIDDVLFPAMLAPVGAHVVDRHGAFVDHVHFSAAFRTIRQRRRPRWFAAV